MEGNMEPQLQMKSWHFLESCCHESLAAAASRSAGLLSKEKVKKLGNL